MLSRVADSLYWLSRYVERAENTARILDVNLQLTLDSEQAGAEDELRDWQPILAALEDVARFKEHFAEINASTVCDYCTFESKNPNSIWACIAAARENARTVREYISSEMWERLNAFWLWVNSPQARRLCQNSGIDFYRTVVDHSHQFQGTTDATVTHGEGWNFLSFGKYVERGDCSSRILDLKYHILLPRGEEVGGAIDTVQWQAVLKSCSAFEAYRKLYPGELAPWRVAEFILFHDGFPRSIRFCVDKIDTALHQISGCPAEHYSNEAERLSGRLCSDLNFTTIGEIFRTGLHEYLDRIQGRLNEISGAMHHEYCKTMEVPAEQSQSQRQGNGQTQTQKQG